MFIQQYLHFEFKVGMSHTTVTVGWYCFHLLTFLSIRWILEFRIYILLHRPSFFSFPITRVLGCIEQDFFTLRPEFLRSLHFFIFQQRCKIVRDVAFVGVLYCEHSDRNDGGCFPNFSSLSFTSKTKSWWTVLPGAPALVFAVLVHREIVWLRVFCLMQSRCKGPRMVLEPSIRYYIIICFAKFEEISSLILFSKPTVTNAIRVSGLFSNFSGEVTQSILISVWCIVFGLL